MRLAKIFLVGLLFIPFAYAKQEAHISDILEGKVKDTSPIAKKRVAEIESRSKAARAIVKEKQEAARYEIERARKQYPEVQRLYDSTYEEAQNTKETGDPKNGTDLALKRLCAEFEKQFLTLMWQFAAGGVGSGENFAGDVWNSRWRESVIDSGTEMGEIGWACVDELGSSSSDKSQKREN